MSLPGRWTLPEAHFGERAVPLHDREPVVPGVGERVLAGWHARNSSTDASRPGHSSAELVRPEPSKRSSHRSQHSAVMNMPWMKTAGVSGIGRIFLERSSPAAFFASETTAGQGSGRSLLGQIAPSPLRADLPFLPLELQLLAGGVP